MALIPEDGSGKSDANSYASLSDADAYFAERYRTDWAALSVDERTGALIAATDYIDLRWGDRLSGKPAFPDQALKFPRVIWSALPPILPVPLPRNLLRATYEYAIIASAGPLAPNPEMDESGRIANTRREKVGPIEEEYRWDAGNTTSAVFRPYSVADALMQCFLKPVGGGVIR